MAMDYMEVGKKLGVLAFLGGFLFAQTLVAAIGAGVWGAITAYELFFAKKK